MLETVLTLSTLLDSELGLRMGMMIAKAIEEKERGFPRRFMSQFCVLEWIDKREIEVECLNSFGNSFEME